MLCPLSGETVGVKSDSVCQQNPVPIQSISKGIDVSLLVIANIVRVVFCLGRKS